MRLANIYLDYVEGTERIGSGQPGYPGRAYLNAIRKRAGVPQNGTGTNALPAPSTQDSMRIAIRNERRVELAFENLRYIDTRSWKIAPQTDAGAFYGMNMYADGSCLFIRKTTNGDPGILPQGLNIPPSPSRRAKS